MSKYKTQRPPERWQSSYVAPVRKLPEKMPPKPRVSKPRRTAAAGSEPPVTFDNQEVADGPSQPYQPQERPRSGSTNKRLNPMTSNAASAALRRAIQSSPARWNSTNHSSIDLEDQDSACRVLFPSPRKDGSPILLGEMNEVVTNVVQFSATFEKEDMIEVPNKENCPPINFDDDDEFMRLFEEEMARPTTPVQKAVSEDPFKTPVRPTPRGRGAHGSASKSVHLTPSRTPRRSPGNFLHITPTQTPRRSPRNHNTDPPGFPSPFTSTMNMLMSEANNAALANSSPSRNGAAIDFDNLPTLPHTGIDPNFSLEDFFSTDVPMPSSPPQAFRLYEDPISLNNINWDEFNKSYNEQHMGVNMPEEFVIKDEPQDGMEKDIGEVGEMEVNLGAKVPEKEHSAVEVDPEGVVPEKESA